MKIQKNKTLEESPKSNVKAHKQFATSVMNFVSRKEWHEKEHKLNDQNAFDIQEIKRVKVGYFFIILHYFIP